MARKRRTPSKPSSEPATTAQTQDNGTTNTTGRKMMALSAEQISAIYAKRRTKGLYTQFLAELLEGGENGVDVKETWPQLKDKKATTIKQGFENAKEKKDAPEGSETVDVIVDGEDVFLINSAMVRELVGAES